MRKLLLASSVFFILIAFSFSSLNSIKSATTSVFIIKELMPDPVGDDGLYEWIELQNISTSTVQLSNYKLNTVKLPSAIILPGEIFILAKNSSYILSRYIDLSSSIYNTSFSLANSGGTVNLTDNTDTILNTFSYSQSQEGKSFELLEGTCGSIVINASTTGNTIGKINSSCVAPTSPAPSSVFITPLITTTPFLSQYSNLIEIYQIKPCADNESIVLKNYDTYAIDLSGWRIEADEKRTAYLTDVEIKSKTQVIIMFESDFFNNAGGRISLIDPSGHQKDIFTYSKCSNATDFFEINNSGNSAASQNIIQCQNSNSEQDLKYPGIYDFRE